MRMLALVGSVVTLALASAGAGASPAGAGVPPYVLGTPRAQFTPAQLGDDHTMFYPKLHGQVFESAAPMAWGPVMVQTRRLLQFVDARLAMAHFDVDSAWMAPGRQKEDIIRVARAMAEIALRLSGGRTPAVFNELTAEKFDGRWSGTLVATESPTAAFSVNAVPDGQPGPNGMTVTLTYSLKPQK